VRTGISYICGMASESRARDQVVGEIPLACLLEVLETATSLFFFFFFARLVYWYFSRMQLT